MLISTTPQKSKYDITKTQTVIKFENNSQLL